MAFNYETLRRACRAKLALLDPPFPKKEARAWENRTFDPPKNEVWCRETLFPVQERRVSFSQIEVIVLIQYDLFVPVGKGTETLGELVGMIVDQFQPSSSVVDEESKVSAWIDRCEPGSPIKDQTQVWWMQPVTLRLRAWWTTNGV
jgi:hypothetical protein